MKHEKSKSHCNETHQEGQHDLYDHEMMPASALAKAIILIRIWRHSVGDQSHHQRKHAPTWMTIVNYCQDTTETYQTEHIPGKEK